MVPAPAHLPIAPGDPGAVVRVHPLLCGRFKIPSQWFHRERGLRGTLRAFGVGAIWLDAPIVAYLVEHPSVGPFLIDTGLKSTIADTGPSENFGRIAALGFRNLEMTRAEAAREQVRQKGVDPATIALVVMTHLHVDHASAIADFRGSTVVVSRGEWETIGSGRAGYRRAQLEAAVDYRLIDFDTDGAPAAGFGATIDLFGDGSVRALSTPGHTHGHVSLLLRIDEGELLVAGDAVFTRRSLLTGEEPWQLADPTRYRESLAQLQAYAKSEACVVLIPGHDTAAWRDLRPVY